MRLSPAEVLSELALSDMTDDADVRGGRLDRPVAVVGVEIAAVPSAAEEIGVGTVDYLNALLAEPFPAFTFSIAGASAYQFGNFGTAAKQLHSFKLTQ
jgi:hypothetical protein